MIYQDIIRQLEALSNSKTVQGMAKFGVTPEQSFGVSIPRLRQMAGKIGKDHELAQKLWMANKRETRILASMIDVPQLVDGSQMDKWSEQFNNWEICDQVCNNLFSKTTLAYRKCFDWSKDEREYVKGAAFVLMSQLAGTDELSDAKLALFMSPIREAASDSRAYVKKTVNAALRQIGKRNVALNKLAMKTAREISELPFKSAQWIGADALQELESDAVQSEVQNTSFRLVISAAGEVLDAEKLIAKNNR